MHRIGALDPSGDIARALIAATVLDNRTIPGILEPWLNELRSTHSQMRSAASDKSAKYLLRRIHRALASAQGLLFSFKTENTDDLEIHTSLIAPQAARTILATLARVTLLHHLWISLDGRWIPFINSPWAVGSNLLFFARNPGFFALAPYLAEHPIELRIVDFSEDDDREVVGIGEGDELETYPLVSFNFVATGLHGIRNGAVVLRLYYDDEHPDTAGEPFCSISQLATQAITEVYSALRGGEETPLRPSFDHLGNGASFFLLLTLAILLTKL